MADALNLVHARRLEISRRIAELQAEDKELATTETVLSRLHEGAQTKAKPAATKKAAANARPTSQRECVLSVLESCEPAWISGNDIVAAARQRWGFEVPQRSLRPLLTLMKRERQIVRNGRLIALPGRATAAFVRPAPASRKGRAGRRAGANAPG
jgi:hypothetical protein